MHIHFIAIGGSAMHNLALALKSKGYHVTGSDDDIEEPSRSRLLKAGLLPAAYGWFPEKITPSVDEIVLGMHARADNPELLRAQELGIKIFSYPEFLYRHSKEKKRIVIGGSHGKTTITAMILHVMNHHKMDFDFMVGSQLQGFDTMVRLTDEAPVIILEGDEYLSSPIDRTPKFLHYHPHLALLSGIAWDHINVFPTFEIYCRQFLMFMQRVEENGVLVYCSEDPTLKKMAESFTGKIKKIGYGIPPHEIINGKTNLIPGKGGRKIPLLIFGDHNLMNLSGAQLICEEYGIGADQFYEAISSFKGAARRLELVSESGSVSVFRDFAHAPSKLKATVNAVKKQFPDRKIIACMELHTFSSLSENFLDEYANSMNEADEAIVYFNPHTIEHKKLKPITPQQIKAAFGKENLEVMTDASLLQKKLLERKHSRAVLLLMSSGTFDGLNLEQFAGEYCS